MGNDKLLFDLSDTRTKNYHYYQMKILNVLCFDMTEVKCVYLWMLQVSHVPTMDGWIDCLFSETMYGGPSHASFA